MIIIVIMKIVTIQIITITYNNNSNSNNRNNTSNMWKRMYVYVICHMTCLGQISLLGRSNRSLSEIYH